MHDHLPITALKARAYTVPTETPESDGTIAWTSTTLVVTEVEAGGKSGIGYSYTDKAAASLIRDLLATLVVGARALDIPAIWQAMHTAVRNIGESGITAMAMAAVDNALWDLKGKLFNVPLATLLGRVRTEVAVYGSGGFTSFGQDDLVRHMVDWIERGYRQVKMKVGRDPERDGRRVAAVRRAIGPDTGLFVDANGAYTVKQALAIGAGLRQESGISWFEEPVVHTDLRGLRAVRRRGPVGVDVAAGEYGFTLPYFQSMLQSAAVDVLQADATRCGISGFLVAAALCEARNLALSAHCAPSLHVPLGVALPAVRHLEGFFDHLRIEHLLFDGAPQPRDGYASPDPSRAGLGLTFKTADALPYAV